MYKYTALLASIATAKKFNLAAYSKDNYPSKPKIHICKQVINHPINSDQKAKSLLLDCHLALDTQYVQTWWSIAITWSWIRPQFLLPIYFWSWFHSFHSHWMEWWLNSYSTKLRSNYKRLVLFAPRCFLVWLNKLCYRIWFFRWNNCRLGKFIIVRQRIRILGSRKDFLQHDGMVVWHLRS